ncbi:ACT domain-containing protein [Clostridiisalibacter paucivorans]|uniref:ACT domain-containing protein n=1 Tax=Clostridiisalibacter paucivorans TaxID=408753 RepID=UPI00047C7291|nr:ACT domain-containing protein [Clostridiisalibacter paucivorans]
MDGKYLVIDKEILPDVFEKVLEAKFLIKTNKVKGITDAVKKVGISRSTFYKYKDYVFTLSEGTRGKKVTISLLLSHKMGVLSRVLEMISENKANVLTINQDIPINEIANVSITFDISNLMTNIDTILKMIKAIPGVEKVDLVAME